MEYLSLMHMRQMSQLFIQHIRFVDWQLALVSRGCKCTALSQHDSWTKARNFVLVRAQNLPVDLQALHMQLLHAHIRPAHFDLRSAGPSFLPSPPHGWR
jgi:hypothetical protein